MNKRIIFDVGHPAQVHNFKLVYKELKEKGCNCLFTAKDKEITLSLLETYDLPYFLIGKSGSNFFSKIYKLIGNCLKFIKILIEFKPDIVVCRFSLHASWCSKLMGIPIIGIADTELTKIQDLITVPLAKVKLTAYSYERDLGKNHFRFNGNIELFYLHPKRFNPLEDVAPLLGISNKESYIIMRFVGWSAFHDRDLAGFSNDNKLKALKEFSKFGRVFISAEKELPKSLEPYRINIPFEKMHDVLANAKLFFGESATMASESAVLGTPAIYYDEIGRGYTREEANYGLVSNFNDKIFGQDAAINKGIELLEDPLLRQNMIVRREKFLNDKIDVTAFLVWFIEAWPGSIKIMRDN